MKVQKLQEKYLSVLNLKLFVWQTNRISKTHISFCFQNHIGQHCSFNRALDWPSWAPPVCGYVSDSSKTIGVKLGSCLHGCQRMTCNNLGLPPKTRKCSLLLKRWSRLMRFTVRRHRVITVAKPAATLFLKCVFTRGGGNKHLVSSPHWGRETEPEIGFF